MEPNSLMLDIGCGNGKYLSYRKDVVSFGCDHSVELINICGKRDLNCFVSDCLNISCSDDRFDYVICIAVLHHLSTKERRVRALNEILRILKPGGKALVTVWAKEQKYQTKDSIYLSRKKQTSTTTDEISKIHKYGQEFENKDVFVAWHYKAKSEKKEPKAKREKRKNKNELKEDKSIEVIPTQCEEVKKKNEEEGEVYLRFYHVFEDGELVNLFEDIKNVKIIDSFYEQGNWACTFTKI
jgi:alkylated DNA repair protein alkB homolog 8